MKSVKSILENLEVLNLVLNLPFLTLLQALNLANFVKFQPSKSTKIHKDQNSELSNELKW